MNLEEITRMAEHEHRPGYEGRMKQRTRLKEHRATLEQRRLSRMNRGGHDRGPKPVEDPGVQCPHCEDWFRNLESHITKSHPEVREAEVDQN